MRAGPQLQAESLNPGSFHAEGGAPAALVGARYRHMAPAATRRFMPDGAVGGKSRAVGTI